MSERSEAQYVKDLLSEMAIKPSRMRGQNFLVEKNLAGVLVSAIGLRGNETVLEIGPGPGVMTEQILSLLTPDARLVFRAVEIEEKFVRALFHRFPDLQPGSVICNDIRKVSALEIFSAVNTFSKCVVISNVPYAISTEVLTWIVGNRGCIAKAGLLLQKEFAQRMCASPGTKTYGSLSVFCQVFNEVELVRTVPGTVFLPKTTVDSAFLVLRPREIPLVEESRYPLFERVVRGAFSKRRKTLLNSLGACEIFSSKDQVLAILKGAGVDPGLRPEVLSIEQFDRIVRNLAEV